MSSASGRMPASAEIATPARSKARRSLASGDRLSKPGSSRPEIASTTRRTAASAGVPAAVSRMAPDANRLRATRNGPRISSSAVIATHVKPVVGGELGGGEQQARLADARLALERDRGQAAGRLAQLLRDRVELGAAPDDRAGRPAQLDRERALRPDERVERAAIGRPHGRATINGRHDGLHAADYGAAARSEALAPWSSGCALVGPARLVAMSRLLLPQKPAATAGRNGSAAPTSSPRS